MISYKHSLQQVAFQFRDQLISDKRKLGFFFGAGTSMAVGLPGVYALTEKIAEQIKEEYKSQFDEIRHQSKTDNIEDILNKLRTIRELIDESEEEIFGIKGCKNGKLLDIEICKTISAIISSTDTSKIEPHLIFANWLFQNQSTRYSPIELFTTNYDLLFEQALEYKKIPYFDGFVGSIQPFLIPECIEAENSKKDQGSYIPFSWIRLWKIHGSINWFLSKDSNNKKRIIRTSFANNLDTDSELMIYPSKQKYDESRRLPFLVFQDRLRKFLSNGETMIVVVGYSFGDDHLNEIILQSLRANKRLAITALMFGDKEVDSDKRVVNPKILDFGLDNPNLTIIGPDKGCIGGVVAEWDNEEAMAANLIFWNDATKNVELGDYKVLSEYLQMNFGLLKLIQEPLIQKETHAK